MLFVFVSLLPFVSVNSYGQIGMITSDFVGLLPQHCNEMTPQALQSSTTPVKVPGRFAHELFRPWVVSPVGRFALVNSPWVVSPVSRLAPI